VIAFQPPPRRRRIPSYRIHKPSGQAVVRLDGKDIYLGLHGTPKSLGAYDAAIAKWLGDAPDEPGPLETGGADQIRSVAAIVARYWQYALSYYVKDGQPTGEVSAIRSALRPLLRLYATEEAAKFGPLKLKAVRNEMIAAGWSRKAINTQIGRIKRLFAWAVENELLAGEVDHALRAVKGLRYGRSAAKESAPVGPAPEAHVVALRPHVSDQVWAMIQLQQLTGMRPGEVVIMRVADLDIPVPARREEGVWTYRPARHKTQHHGHARIIYLGPKAQGVISPFLRRALDAYLFSPAEARASRYARMRQRRRSAVQPSQVSRAKRRPKREPGSQYTPDSYRRAIHRACRAANVPHWHPNQLRHAAGTRLEKLFGIDVARAVLGHRSPAVTETYVKRDASIIFPAVLEVG